MSDLTFIPIERDGTTVIPPADLPAAAREVCDAMAGYYPKVGHTPPWIGYLASRAGTVVGSCAFKTPPQDNEVEIAYYTLPEWEGQGIATAMARQLIVIAREAQPGIIVTAQTLPHPNASASLLTKLGFVQQGTAIDDEAGEVWCWYLIPDDTAPV